MLLRYWPSSKQGKRGPQPERASGGAASSHAPGPGPRPDGQRKGAGKGGTSGACGKGGRRQDTAARARATPAAGHEARPPRRTEHGTANHPSREDQRGSAAGHDDRPQRREGGGGNPWRQLPAIRENDDARGGTRSWRQDGWNDTYLQRDEGAPWTGENWYGSDWQEHSGSGWENWQGSRGTERDARRDNW